MPSSSEPRSRPNTATTEATGPSTPIRYSSAIRNPGYVAPLLTEEIIDFPEEEGDALLKTIYEIQERPEFVVEHTWRKGDFVLFDNRYLTHARTDFPTDQIRQMRRVTLLKEAAV